ncbi:MAG: AAA family ATPase [Candidatus Pristimantibacillus sp.]
MRPLKLTMTAFGPYRDAEVIDFTKLDNHRLFVISGSTGAGKTSIFDAICFALYGVASGEDRSEPRMLRSHFADDETHTAVEFEFAVGSRSYRLFRQLPHRKGSNKSETGGKAELFELSSGIEVPAIDRFTVSDVNAKLESIIGLSKEQFNQIVMLPQGEFRKLLTSDTDNKEEILRRIFRTELYQRLETRFQQRNRELNDALKEAMLRSELYMKQTAESLPQREDSALSRVLEQEVYNAAQLSEGLGLEIVYYRDMAKQGEAGKANLQSQLEAQEIKLRDALALNTRFNELASERMKREQLDGRQAEVTEWERKLILAERAASITPYAEQVGRAEQDAQAKRLQSEVKRKSAETALLAREEASLRHGREVLRETERQEAERELHRLIELAPIVNTLDSQRLAVEQLMTDEKNSVMKLEQIEAQITTTKENKLQRSAKLKEIEGETASLQDKLDQLRQVEQQGKHITRLIELDKEISLYAKLEAEREQALAAIRSEHERLENRWIEGQASLLAAHLHDGKPCPVCGSPEHPEKAELAEAVPSREQLQQAKEQLSRFERELNESKLQAAAARASWDGSAAELAEYGAEAKADTETLSQQQSSLRQRWKLLKDEADRLQGQSKLVQELKQQAEELDSRVEKLLQVKDQLQRDQQRIAVERGAKQSVLEKELERIPSFLRSPEQMAHRLSGQRQLTEALAASWKIAQEQLHHTQTKAAEEKVHAEQTEQQFIEAKRNVDQAVERLTQVLAKAEFESLDQYRAAELPGNDRILLKQQIDDYKTNLLAAVRRIAELELELSGKQPSNMELLNAESVALKQQLESIVSVLQTAARYEEEASRLKKALDGASVRTKELESSLEQVLDVYQMLKGDNALKISFERYILIEFLEQILHAANVRLRNLSGGQFVLQRSDRLETRGKQSGLGLDIYDAYTGQNRDVKTMSGGEKFNASLCLALGMTDVIQSHQGGISIEMMFIDEGFGSLDEDALNKAIEALIDLQRAGRMIGVISHVQELKHAFPASLEVHKTKEGYSRTSITVK